MRVEWATVRGALGDYEFQRVTLFYGRRWYRVVGRDHCNALAHLGLALLRKCSN